MKGFGVLRWPLTLIFLVAALSACNGNDAGPAKSSAVPVAQTNPAASGSTATSDASTSPPARITGSDTSQAEKPAQVSETGDDSETIDDATPAPNANSQPPLKLAAAAAPEGTHASQFKEGVHYQRLVPTQPTSVSPGQTEVLEVFWYGCPHCFALDSKLEAWRQKGKANYVAFQRMPATWNDATLFHGRLFYVAEQLGKLEEVHTPLFREIHLNGNPLNTADKAKAFFATHGVSKADFDKTFASFGVNTKVQTAGVLNRRYHVEGVPFFVINGKYTFDVSSAGGEDQVVQLINELATREHH